MRNITLHFQVFLFSEKVFIDNKSEKFLRLQITKKNKNFKNVTCIIPNMDNYYIDILWKLKISTIYGY